MKQFVTGIIPCYNEEKFIAKCLDSVVANDYPKENLEIIVIDGMSIDRTREIINEYAKKFPFIKILDNPKKYQVSAVNIGIKNARGDIIVRMDAHATYKSTYITKCVKYLIEYNADCTGGMWKILPENDSIIANAIVLILANPFGTGNSYFKIGIKKPREVDTVFGGCYRKEIFEELGFLNENLVGSEDFEFNSRLKRAGKKIVLFSDIIAFYYPKSRLFDFLRHNIRDGIWAIYPLKFGVVLKLRHYLPFLFIGGLIILGILSFLIKFFLYLFLAIIILYAVLSLCFSLMISIREKNIKLLFPLIAAFLCRHFGYGLGSIWALLKVMPTKKFWRNLFIILKNR